MTMIVKKPILPGRVRRIPGSFSWVDHGLVRDRHLEKCSHTAAALYLFLVCVGDRQGLSYYSDETLAAKLRMAAGLLEQARSELIRNDLVAWRRPMYQVLSLEPATERRASQVAMSLGAILRQAGEAAHD
jgi:hypothetical protein